MPVSDFMTLLLVSAACVCILSHETTGDSTLDQMEKKLNDLHSKVLSQEELNHHLQSRVSAQDMVIHQLESKASLQEKQIIYLQSKEFQEGTLPSRQQNSLAELQKRVSRLEKRVRRHETSLRQQRATIKHLNLVNTPLLSQTPFIPNAKQNVSLATPDQFHLEPEDRHHFPGPNASLDHDVSARSDDAGPLQAVVSGLGQEVSQLSADFQTISSQIQTLQSGVLDARTATFIHWGSGQCSSSHAQLVYSGVVGGKSHLHLGSGVNLLCLTLSPIMSNHSVPATAVAYLYGAEYQTYDAAEDKDPVCAVCRSSFSSVVMIPGTSACVSGWTPLYSGYLMAQYYSNQQANEFVCVDSALQSRAGSDHNDNGALLYFTASHCGSLPCGPYVNNRIVTCVVCGR